MTQESGIWGFRVALNNGCIVDMKCQLNVGKLTCHLKLTSRAESFSFSISFPFPFPTSENPPHQRNPFCIVLRMHIHILHIYTHTRPYMCRPAEVAGPTWHRRLACQVRRIKNVEFHLLVSNCSVFVECFRPCLSSRTSSAWLLFRETVALFKAKPYANSIVNFFPNTLNFT